MTKTRGSLCLWIQAIAWTGLLGLAGCRVKALENYPVRSSADASDAPGASIDPEAVRPDTGMTSPQPCAKPAKAAQAGEPCGCDQQCATGFCQAGLCCGGAGCDARPSGAPCQTGAQCDSGFCADGVCCTVACAGACVSCNQPEREGECVPVPAGMPDVHDVCRKDTVDTCGQSGLCNGAGGCAKYAAGTPCGVSRCSDARTQVNSAECDGEGTCGGGGTVDCAPFGCEGSGCRTTCAAEGQCTAPAVCTDGSCGKRGLGQACTEGGQCGSGFCVDGVCCENACAGKCQFCASATGKGKCTAVRAGSMDPRAAMGVTDPAAVCLDGGPTSCGDNGRCDGAGGCQKYGNGIVCKAGRCDPNANNEVGAGVCMNGSCRVPAARSCAPYQGCSGTRCIGQCGSDAQCVTPNVCAEGDCGKRPVGAVCTRNQDCAAPGICAQGRCCASQCTAPCMACNLEGQQGVCSAVPAGGADPTGTCRNDACSNGCDGTGGCRREPVGTVCRAATCTGSNLTRHACSAEGVCTAASSTCPAGEICMGARCVPMAKKPPGEICLGNEDCQSNACVGGRCCASACAVGPCRACSLVTGWKCAASADGTDCGVGRVCQGGTCSKKGPGAACATGLECQSGSCIGGNCCATACSGPPCRNCNAATMWRCENVVNDTACGVGGSQVCREGACVPRCPAGRIFCGGVCVDPESDPSHCGGCRITCPTKACMGGKCAGAPDDCPGLQIRCGGVCINPRRNNEHCGGCDKACRAPTPECRQGTCVDRDGILPPLPSPL